MALDRWRSRWPRLQSSMWFVPGLMVVGSIVVAQAVVWVDGEFPRDRGVLPGSAVLGVEGSRGILVAVGGSVLAVAATMFSITMSVIATASSTYGPRLVRNFMADRSNQRVLGLFVATFVYCLMVLRRIEDPTSEGGGVPHLAVFLSIVLALACVAGLVYFLHHIADVIQVATLVRRVRAELEAVAETLYGEQARERRAPATPLPADAPTVASAEAGFVTRIDATALVEALRRHDARVDLLAQPGTHVLVGEPLARFAATPDAADAVVGAVRDHVHVGDVRTPEQDILLAVQQLVEMAVRAVSPSMNDPYTARNAVDELACGLVPAMADPAPQPGWEDGDGTVRLRWGPTNGADLVDAVFDDLRVYAASDPLVVRAGLRLGSRLLAVAGEETRQRLHRQLDELMDAVAVSGLSAFDVTRLRELREDLGAGH